MAAVNSLQKFLNAASSDTIRCTNQFELQWVTGIQEIDALMEDTMIFGQGFTIPSRSIEYASVSFKGYEVPNLVPTRIEMQKEISMEILEDVNGTNRRVFEAAMNHVMNFDIEGGSLFEGDRGVNPNSVLRLHLFDKDNETVIQTYKFWNVHVKSVGETSLTYSGGDAARFTVSFVCSYWSLEDNKKGGLTGLK